MASGWIMLSRDIMDHWIFDDADYFRAWCVILMEVNHKKRKTLIKGKLLECGRGESLLSHSGWAKKLGSNWNRARVIRFFKLLESECMVVTKSEQVTTHLKVNNYARYQSGGSAKRTGDGTGDGTPTISEITENGENSEQVTVQPKANNCNGLDDFNSMTRTGDSTPSEHQTDTNKNVNNGINITTTTTDTREKFKIHNNWEPTFDEMVLTALKKAGVDQELINKELNKYIAVIIGGDREQTQHQWNQSFKSTLMKIGLNQHEKHGKRSSTGFDAATAIANAPGANG